MANKIKVPKPSREAFDPNRPLEKNQLIQAQVRHFQHVEEGLPAELQSGIHIDSIKTEGQAAEYVRRVTRAVHEGGGRPAPKVEKA